MHVVATAGHVDHGKSTLVRAVTGMEPDRWAEERRRGLTIDLGFAWTVLPSGTELAFVDVPGHERFVPNMLAGVGPVPAVLFVVAADEGWRAQSAEHLAALDALQVRHGVLAVTRADLADPAPATAQAVRELGRSSIGSVDAVAVSGRTGAGLAALSGALDRLVRAMPAPDPGAAVRLWVDRCFTIKGAGTVVTGTLPAGRLRLGDELELRGRTVRVRGLQSLERARAEVAGIARVAVNLRGLDRAAVARGDALLTPGAWLSTATVDVRLHPSRVPAGAAEPRPDREGARLPGELVLHVGSAAVAARPRLLGPDTARLTLARALPLRIGDRGLLRDPGRHQVVAGVTALDVLPPPLRGRASAAVRARELAPLSGAPDGAGEVRRRGVVAARILRAIGAPSPYPPLSGDWVVDPELASGLRARLSELVAAYAEERPLESGLPVEAARARLGLPDPGLVEALRPAGVVLRDGRLTADAPSPLPAALEGALAVVQAELAREPFRAPETPRLVELGLDPARIAAAARAGRLLRLADGVVLLPDAVRRAADLLARLGGPFTVSDARRALGTSRRVAVPLLELLDRRGVTRRLPDDRRVLTGAGHSGKAAGQGIADEVAQGQGGGMMRT